MEVDLKPIPGAAGKYFAGTDGEIYNHKRVKLKRRYNGSGYPMVVLYLPEGRKYRFIHKLVGEACVANTGGTAKWRWKDDDRQNCKPSNLMMDTR